MSSGSKAALGLINAYILIMVGFSPGSGALINKGIQVHTKYYSAIVSLDAGNRFSGEDLNGRLPTLDVDGCVPL